MKAKETFDNFINVGHEIHCDIAPQALEPDAWVATVAWIGGLDAKPDIEAINWHHQLNRNAQRGKVKKANVIIKAKLLQEAKYFVIILLT